MKNKKLTVSVVALIITALLTVFGYYGSEEIKDKTSNLQQNGTIVVHFLDVGQGDSEFIQLPEGKCMLIDAATAEYGNKIIEQIKALGYTKIDYLVATHPHSDLNNYSAVVRLVYGNHSFVFMGDAEVISENEIQNTYSAEILKADVLKVGHHGSNTASSAAFINTVSPKYAVIEVGKDNSYHHPHYEAVNHLNEAGASIFRTDINGTVSFVSDKENLTIICEKE